MRAHLVIFFTAALAFAGCSAQETSPSEGAPSDAGGSLDSGTDGGLDASVGDDAGAADAAEPLREQEPNGGATETEFDPFSPPGAIAGSIDPANDIDILGFEPRPGDVIVWRLSAEGGALAPHLAIFEAADVVPDMVAIGAPGSIIEQEQLVLAGGRWYAAIRDARNVPDPSGAGGPGYRWLLEARAESREPTPVSFPSTVEGSLAHPFAVALYKFSADADFAFDIDLRAERKSPASDMDSRMSLFNATAGQWVITNDDQSRETTDSHIGGDGLPAAGEHWILVENVAPEAVDLSFELALTLRR
jgi:hypothetical protein